MKLAIALDLPSKNENLHLIDSINHFKNHDIVLKIGLRAFIRDGANFVMNLKDKGYSIFLDLKLYDIPNTMLGAVMECMKLKVDFLTIHASSGKIAMQEIANLINKENSNLKIIGVSALTSFDENTFKEVYNNNIQTSVYNFANMIYTSNLHGIVCSGYEIKLVKNISQGLFCIVPGIRLSKNIKNDQNRIMDIKTAKSLGADMIVMGREIYECKNVEQMLENIVQQL